MYVRSVPPGASPVYMHVRPSEVLSKLTGYCMCGATGALLGPKYKAGMIRAIEKYTETGAR